MGVLKRVKDRLYFHLVEKKPVIKQLYQGYVDANKEYHKKHRIRSWIFMISLNFAYGGKKSHSVASLPPARPQMNTTEQLAKRPPKQSVKRPVEQQPVEQQPAKQQPVPKLPYMDGAESSIVKRPSAIHFAKTLMNYDVISFDILDTLILRPFAKPSDLFMLVGSKLNYIDFMRIRIEAEREAREYARFTKGNYEVTIYDIYKIIENRTGIDSSYGARLEFETELEMCFANPYMKRVFKLLKDKGKTIIAVSDMYLPSDLMFRLLERCGYIGFSDVFVSCDYQCSKRTKGLYENVLYQFGRNTTIVHIGDNYTTDILHAQEMGLEARYYKNVHEAGRPYRADGMSELIGSAYAGVVNTHFHNGNAVYSPYYEFGFLYGGLYVLGYCNWIYKNAKKNNIDKVLFLSRDGDIYQRVFNMMFDDMPNEYVYWSRIANIKYSLKNDRNEFLIQMVQNKAAAAQRITITSLLDSMCLSHLKDKLRISGLHEKSLVTNENVKLLRKFFIDNWQDVVESYSVQVENMSQLLGSIIGSAEKVAVVDVGWIGSGPMGIKYLVEKEWGMNCEVFCFLAGSKHFLHTANLNELLSEKLQPYMFSRIFNRDQYDIHVNTNKQTNSIYFELFTQACYPTFSGLDNEGNFQFDIPEVENYETIKQIHQGIYDFCHIYKTRFKSYPHMLNIAGSDAYQPFSMIIRDLKFIKRFFSDFLYCRETSGDSENQTISSLGQIMRKKQI